MVMDANATKMSRGKKKSEKGISLTLHPTWLKIFLGGIISTKW
jgi:hypothetical protein